jgi:hypothetical protein
MYSTQTNRMKTKNKIFNKMYDLLALPMEFKKNLLIRKSNVWNVDTNTRSKTTNDPS